MLFLLLRLLPAIIPILFFICAKAVFYYADQWLWFLALIIILPLAYFALLKHKNRDKPVVWLGIFALIFASVGFAYALVLENPLVINAYLIGWSLIYWLFLESVFHDFYETARTFVFNLVNVTLYGGLLAVFFLTATLASYNIFLNLSLAIQLPISIVAYFSVAHLVFLRHGFERKQALLYAFGLDLILTEILAALLFLPCSFYVIAIAVALCYYLLVQILLYINANKLNRKVLLELLIFCGLILLAVVLTAAWL